MTWMPVDLARRAFPPERTSPVKDSRQIPTALWIAGTTLRVVFIACLLLITLRVSMPQSETIWSAYETPADLIRMLLGLGVCAWLVLLLFQGPKDAQGYRTWLYLGLAAVPFALILLFAIW